MDQSFHKQLDVELNKSELLRTRLTVVILLIVIAIAGINYSLGIGAGIGNEYQESLEMVLLFLGIVLIIELIQWKFLSGKFNTHTGLAIDYNSYIHSFLEISSPTFLILLLSGKFSTPSTALELPIVFAYFLFIILSTLKLNYKLVLFTGFLAAGEFLLISLFLFRKEPAFAKTNQQPEALIAIAKAGLLLLSGIAASFITIQIKDKMSRALDLAENEQRLTKLINQQLSREVAANILATKGNVERKMERLSIMFVDIRNFTKQTEGKSFEEYVHYQNNFFSIIIEAANLYNGTIHQFLGDGCMISFHDSEDGRTSENLSLNAAFAIQNKLSEAIEKENIEPTTIGIGIHSGDVMVGNIGNEERQQYSISGSTVILAARIEQLNKAYQTNLLVSEAIIESVESDLAAQFQSIGKIEIKGWKEKIGIYSQNILA